MSSELPNGLYEIRNHQTGRTVFRYPAEPRDSSPKPVFALGSDVKPIGHWQVEKVSDGEYKLKAFDPVGPLEKGERLFVYAFLLDGEGPIEWKVTKVLTTEQREGWIIETHGDGGEQKGWSASGEVTELGIQIAVRPLPSTRSFPPQYFPSDVFEFVRLDREE